MFERLGGIVLRFRFPFLAGWVVLAVVAVLFAPKLEDVGSSDETQFLPRDSESMAAGTLLSESFPSDSAPGQATIVFSRPEGLSDDDRAYIGGLPDLFGAPDAPEALHSVVLAVVTAADHPEYAGSLRSTDGVAEIVRVDLDAAAYEQSANEAVFAMRELLDATAPEGLQANVTGRVGLGADYIDAVVRATDQTTVVTIVLVVLILLAIYRAPLAALAPLVTIGVAWVVSRGLLGVLAAAGWQISSVIDSFVVVLVFGVGTDYTIFLISRVREELGRDRWATASRRAVGKIGSVITASAATVVVGLSAMAVARFGLIQTIGPALALTIVVTLLAGLTLTPAYLGIFGRHLFWPIHGRLRTGDGRRGIWAAISRAVTSRPGIATLVLFVVLGLPAFGLVSFRSNFDQLSELPADGDGRVGIDVVTEHFEQGRLFPATVVIDAPGRDLSSPESLALVEQVQATLVAIPGVGSVSSLVAPGGDGLAPDGFRPSVQLQRIADGLAPQDTDPVAGLERLLDPATAAGLDEAAAYVASLGEAYPDLTALPAFTRSVEGLNGLTAEVEDVRASLRVSAQLEAIAGGIRAGGDQDVSMGTVLVGFLGELQAAYPEVAGYPEYQAVWSVITGMAGGADPASLDRLADAFEGLAARFEDRPDATLVSPSLLAVAGAEAAAGPASAVESLQADLESLAGEFADRPDFFIPADLGGDTEGQLALIEAVYLSPERDVTRLTVILDEDPYSPEALEVVNRMRAAADPAGSDFGPAAEVLVGGTTAAFVDIRQTINEDFYRVAAITIAGVLLVLMALLRAVIAPLYLVATVLLSWAGTMGISTLVFQDALGHPAVNYFLPLIVFVLLVAIGSDYNIFLMSRVREESERHGVLDGIQVASAHTGTVITSAGIILAGTFAALIAAPLRFLFQIGFAVALGVLIDTFVVRSLLVPAITALLGERAWWPSRLRRRGAGS